MNTLFLFIGEGFIFLIATLNVRACAKGWIGATICTDGLLAAVNFLLIHQIAAAGDLPQQLAFTAGAMSGSAIGMVLTRGWSDAR